MRSETTALPKIKKYKDALVLFAKDEKYKDVPDLHARDEKYKDALGLAAKDENIKIRTMGNGCAEANVGTC